MKRRLFTAHGIRTHSQQAEIFVKFSRLFVPEVGPVLSSVVLRNSETVVRPNIPVLLAGASCAKIPEPTVPAGSLVSAASPVLIYPH